MTTPAVTVDVKAPLTEIMGLFRKHGINRLPAPNEAGKLIGIVTRADVLKSLAVLMDGEQ